MVAIMIIGKLDAKRHSTTDIYDTQGELGTTMGRDHCEPKKIAIEVVGKLNADRGVKKQNGKRTREDGEPSYTLTAQEPQGVAVDVARNSTQDEHPPIYVELENGHKAYCIWYPKKECYITIRRLTPREYFRLQGWNDEYFDKAQFVNSDSQLYKQAGNGVTVQVVEAIGKKLKEIEEDGCN